MGTSSSTCQSGAGIPNLSNSRSRTQVDHLAVDALVQPRRTVGGVGRDVAVEDDDVVGGAQACDLVLAPARSSANSVAIA